LESLEVRLRKWMKDPKGFPIEEFEEERGEVVYVGSGTNIVMDYARAYTPSRCMGTG
jgi:hypothetical protein